MEYFGVLAHLGSYFSSGWIMYFCTWSLQSTMLWMCQNILGESQEWTKTTRQQGEVYVCIPQIVDYYNHWICGIDMAHKKIRYYNPYLHWRRIWIPMFIQLFLIIIFNSYIRYVSHYKGTKHYKHVITHQYIFMKIVRHLLNISKYNDSKRQFKRVQEEEWSEIYTSIPLKKYLSLLRKRKQRINPK